ncbi:ATP synthase subunit beta [Trichinella spiralis]|uniref:ATP synthase subunit beta n=1 Tax=Trichinella spiralis TaxID=6334 RepID=A0ABR3KGF1_TRISP
MPSSQNLLFSASCSSLQNCRKGDESGLLKYFRGGIFVTSGSHYTFLLNNLLQNIEYGSNGAFRNTVKSQSSNECAAVNNPMNLPPASRMAEAWACVDKNFPTASQASVNIEINGDL